MPKFNLLGMRQVCLQCGWKNPIVEHSDCLKYAYASCPECGGQLEWRQAYANEMEAMLKGALGNLGKLFKK